MADSDLENLEYLSLVAKITQEFNNYMGMQNKEAAEFLIGLHEESKGDLAVFKNALLSLDSGLPNSLIESVDRLILSMHPKYKKQRASKTTDADGKSNNIEKNESVEEKERQRRLFPGLALKNKDVPPAVPDDVFLEELGDLVSGRKSRPRPTEDERSPKRQRRDRSRSRSPRRRSPSPPRRKPYGDRRNDTYKGTNGERQHLDDRPVLFKIYDGKVSGIKDFGAFVQLEGVAGRVEGMCIVKSVSVI